MRDTLAAVIADCLTRSLPVDTAIAAMGMLVTRRVLTKDLALDHLCGGLTFRLPDVEDGVLNLLATDLSRRLHQAVVAAGGE